MKWSAIVVVILTILLITVIIQQRLPKHSITESLIKEQEPEKVTCSSPYTKIDEECCLDQNTNRICDEEEILETRFSPVNYYLKPISFNISFPMLLGNNRWYKLPISVYIDKTKCSLKEEEIKSALKIWEIETSVNLFEIVNSKYADVYVNCLPESQVETEIIGEYIYTTVGEGGPTNYSDTGLYNLTYEGGVNIYVTTRDCIEPIRILHELGHILGFGHTDDEKNIMYKYETCQQDFSNEMKQTIEELYSRSDLYFVNASAKLVNSQLSLDIIIGNRVMPPPPPSYLRINANNITLEDQYIGTIDFNLNKTLKFEFNVSNEIDRIELTIDPLNNVNEIDKTNNIITLRSE